MPNYNLVINSQFQPFSYQEMLSPVLMATQAHQDLENQYADLTTKANIWDKMANEQQDPKAYGIYKSYATALQNQANDLNENGLNINSRNALMQMKARYSKDITPIENAYTQRQKQAQIQQQAMLQDPTTMFSRLASATSLDKYMDNPNLDFQNYSGKLLTAQVAQAASNIKNQLTNFGTSKKLDAFTSTFLKQHGYNAAQVLQAINNPNDSTSSKVLNNIVNSVMKSSGMANWADTNTYNRGLNYAKEGLYSAIGQSDVTPFEDKGAIMAAQFKYDMAKLRAQQQDPMQQSIEGSINPVGILSTKERTTADDNFDKFKKYFTVKNGKYYLNNAGKNMYYTNAATPYSLYPNKFGVVTYEKNKQKFKGTAFRDFVDKTLGGAKYMSKTAKDIKPGSLGNLFAKYKAQGYVGYDALRRTEYDYGLAGAQQDIAKSALLKGYEGYNKIYTQVFDAKQNKFVKDKAIDYEDINDKDAKVISTRFSRFGSSALIATKDKGVIRVQMPQVNPINQKNTLQQLTRAGQIEDLLRTNHYNTQTEAKLREEYQKELSSAYMYWSQIFNTNETTPTKYQQYVY